MLHNIQNPARNSSAIDDVVTSFRDAMTAAGVEPTGPIIADGRLHRFDVRGDRTRSETGWYVLHPDAPAAGAFGCWKRGIRQKWAAQTTRPLTRSERQQNARRVAEAVAAADRQREAEYVAATDRADALWAKASEIVDPSHGYLLAKQIQPPFGVRQLGDALVVPLSRLFYIGGGVASTQFGGLQFINESGRKTFLRGSRLGSAFHIVTPPEQIVRNGNRMIVAEGLATAQTIYEATGGTVVCAFNAGNLQAVGEMLKSYYPGADLVFAADDDQATPGNPGRAAAEKAARVLHAGIAYVDPLLWRGWVAHTPTVGGLQ